MTAAKGCLLIAGMVTIAVVGIVAYLVADYWRFGSEEFQRDDLSSYIPTARCNDADFALIERSDAIQDWRYVVRISGSAECSVSLREALRMKGAKLSRYSSSPGYLLPGHEDPEHELVTFDFRQPNVVVWTRDKT